MSDEKECLYDTFLNEEVIIKCNDGSSLQGKTLSIDGYLNVSLECVKVYEYGIHEPMNLSTTYIRGPNIEYIALKNAGK